MLNWRAAVCARWLALHFFLVSIVCLGDVSSIFAGGQSLFSSKSRLIFQQLRMSCQFLLGDRLTESNAYRQIMATYISCAGIELGYSYFAPSVPGNGKLLFELHYPDGRVEYDSPEVSGAAAGYRVATLLDNLQRLHYPPLREGIVKTLVYSIRREHPDVAMIRAIFLRANLPTATEYSAGRRISYELLDAYDSTFAPLSH